MQSRAESYPVCRVLVPISITYFIMNAKNTGTGSSTVPQYGTYTVLQPIFRASDDSDCEYRTKVP